MNIKLSLWKEILLAAMPAMAASVHANTFTYTNGNVLICFRQDLSGSKDLIVNAGPISYFTNLAPNTTVTITGYTNGQLGPVGTNSIDWSAWTYFDSSAANAPLTNTLYMTRARSGLNAQTDPYYRDIPSAQNHVISKLKAIVQGAVDNASYSALNSSTAVLESESYNYSTTVSYAVGLGVPDALYNFEGTFQDDPEQTTGDEFTTGATPVRADFYQLIPTGSRDFSEPLATNGFLGYFTFSTNGIMAYTAYPAAVVVTPVIVSFSRTNTTSAVTFTTGSSGTYTLRGANSLISGTAPTDWPAISSVSGDGGNHSLQDITSSSNKFYIITAQ
jgi:hypothetical protein